MIGRILATLALLALVACSSNEPLPASDEVTYELAGTRWALVQLGGKTVKTSESGRETYIVLNSVELTAVGFAGCNRISTNYKSTGSQLSFGKVNATRMVCTDMPIETGLLQAMQATASWRISGSHLELLDARQTSLARFEARNL